MQQAPGQEARNKRPWSAPTSNAEAAARAGGRAHYNSVRQFQAVMRQRGIIERWEELSMSGGSLFDRGMRAKLAEELGVHRSTISRDVRRMQRDWPMYNCPTCGSVLVAERWRDLIEEGRVA